MEITPLPVPFNGNSIKLRMVQWHDENETRIEVCLQETQERAEVTFDAVIGIRILYELDTSEFWLSTPRNILSSSWIFHIQSWGWFEFESQREDFYSKHEDINIREYLITGYRECVSIFSLNEPKVKVISGFSQ